MESFRPFRLRMPGAAPEVRIVASSPFSIYGGALPCRASRYSSLLKSISCWCPSLPGRKTKRKNIVWTSSKLRNAWNYLKLLPVAQVVSWRAMAMVVSLAWLLLVCAPPPRSLCKHVNNIKSHQTPIGFWEANQSFRILALHTQDLRHVHPLPDNPRVLDVGGSLRFMSPIEQDIGKNQDSTWTGFAAGWANQSWNRASQGYNLKSGAMWMWVNRSAPQASMIPQMWSNAAANRVGSCWHVNQAKLY